MKFFATLLLLALLLAAAAAYLIYTPYGPHSETFVEIVPGTGTQSIAAQLQASGIIRNRYAFDLLYILKSLRNPRSATLKAGEYRFDHPTPMTDAYARIARGDVYTLTLTIPEGFNLFDIAQAIESTGLGSRTEFLAAARQHTELIALYFPEDAPRPPSLEGYLFPDTYHFARHTPPLQMLPTMVRRFRLALTQLEASGDIPPGGLDSRSIPRTVLIASLVEKEVSQDSERPLVAGVFLNRLAKGIPLATDPTVIYAALLEGRWRGTIYASDLQNPSPYNTYRHPGLPPGPICNPGLAALRAALHPAQNDFLYFVSDSNGHSRFSAGLKEHAAQVQTYRQAQKSTPPPRK